MTKPGAVSDLSMVEDAFVPIIKFEFDGISIDLIFSRIASLKQLPKEKDWSLKDSNLLRGLDEAELRSLNGTRVTDEIIDLVPEPSTFRLSLRAIKLWAQRRAIYANIMGFPGGVAWAMLVARVCQLYPKAASCVIVNKFFHIMRRWPWPQPVLLKTVESGPLQVRVWNPKVCLHPRPRLVNVMSGSQQSLQVYKGDQFHLMPIITPAYPSMCATYNITKSAMTIIQQELQRGCDITDSVMLSKRPWSDLFIKHTFFTASYKYYISVITTSKTKEAHKIWSGYVESKVRVLVQGLEQHPSIDVAQPFNKGYDRRHICRNENEIACVQDGDFSYLAKEGEATANGQADDSETLAATTPLAQPDLQKDGMGPEADQGPADDPIVDEPAGPTEIFTTTHYIGLQLKEGRCLLQLRILQRFKKKPCVFLYLPCVNLINGIGAKSLDLSYQVDSFKQLCMQWEKYKKELNHLSHLSIQHVRKYGGRGLSRIHAADTSRQLRLASRRVRCGRKQADQTAQEDYLQRTRLGEEEGPIRCNDPTSRKRRAIAATPCFVCHARH